MGVDENIEITGSEEDPTGAVSNRLDLAGPFSGCLPGQSGRWLPTGLVPVDPAPLSFADVTFGIRP